MAGGIDPARKWAQRRGLAKMASGNDIKAAEATYSGFISLIKVSIPVLAIITIVVVALIS